MKDASRRAFVKRVIGSSFALISGIGSAKLMLGSVLKPGLESDPATGPTIERNLFHWKMAIPLSRHFASTVAAEHFTKSIAEKSGGEFRIDLLEFTQSGVPANRIAESVRQGVLDLGHCSTGSCMDLNPRIGLLSDLPFNIESSALTEWAYGRGEAQLDELFKPAGLKVLVCLATQERLGAWYSSPIESMDDLRSRKIRVGNGIESEALRLVGAQVSNRGIEHLGQRVQTGELGGAIMTGAHMAAWMNVQKALPHYYSGEWHSKHKTMLLVVNRKKWDQLPEHLKKIVRESARETHQRYTARWAKLDRKFWTNLESAGIQVHAGYPEDVERALLDARAQVFKRIAARGHLIGAELFPSENKLILG